MPHTLWAGAQLRIGSACTSWVVQVPSCSPKTQSQVNRSLKRACSVCLCIYMCWTGIQFGVSAALWPSTGAYARKTYIFWYREYLRHPEPVLVRPITIWNTFRNKGNVQCEVPQYTRRTLPCVNTEQTWLCTKRNACHLAQVCCVFQLLSTSNNEAAPRHGNVQTLTPTARRISITHIIISEGLSPGLQGKQERTN